VKSQEVSKESQQFLAKLTQCLTFFVTLSESIPSKAIGSLKISPIVLLRDGFITLTSLKENFVFKNPIMK
jgi:hypothetical protein